MNNLTVIIPFYNGHQYITGLLNDLKRYDLPVIIVDDKSDEPLQLKGYWPKVTVMRPERKGYFTGAVNSAIMACDSDVLVLNQDARLAGHKWLDLIADNRDRFAMIGERIKGNHPAWPSGYIHGTFMYARRDAIEKAGLMNEVDFPLWGSTCDWQTRFFRKGFNCLAVQSLPGFSHDRHGRFGSSINTALKRHPENQDWYIRTPPLVSVITPCYNYGKYLPDLVASLIGGDTSLGYMPGQTFQAFRLIIVDDGSDDGETQEIIASLVDPRKGIISIRRNKRGGTPAANNTGIRASYGRAVTVIGADDMMEPERLEKMYRLWDEDKTRVVYDDNWMFKDNERFHHFHMREYDFDDLLKKNSMHCGIMYSRKAFNQVGGYPEAMTMGREDWAMNVRLGIAGYCGYHLREPLYLYRREGQNRTNKNTNPKWREYFLAQMRALYPKIYAGERPMACCGRGKSKPSSKSVPLSAPLIGGDGMTLLTYVGLNYGTSTWFGPITGQAYKFGKNKPNGFVDDKDLRTGSSRKPGLLEISENGKPVFVVKPVVADIAAIAPPAAIAAVLGDAPMPEPGSEEEPDTLELPDLEEMTGIEVIEYAQDLDNATLQLLIEKEKDGKNRKTVIKALETAL